MFKCITDGVLCIGNVDNVSLDRVEHRYSRTVTLPVCVVFILDVKRCLQTVPPQDLYDRSVWESNFPKKRLRHPISIFF